MKEATQNNTKLLNKTSKTEYTESKPDG